MTTGQPRESGVLAFLGQFVDPDRVWFARDKYQHGGFLLAFGYLGARLAAATLPLPALAVALVVLVVGCIVAVTYELGQTDTAYASGKIYPGHGLLGRPGFGFGLLDLTWDLAGLVIGIAVWLGTS
jgi:hypothetical protein